MQFRRRVPLSYEFHLLPIISVIGSNEKRKTGELNLHVVKGDAFPLESNGAFTSESRMLEDLLSDFLILNTTHDLHHPPWIFGASQRVDSSVSFVRRRIPSEEGSS
jgi:hypothetical protein